MGKRLIHAGLAAGLAVAAALAAAGPLLAQRGQQPGLDPEDELSPAQMKQPMPSAAPDAGATPAPTTAPAGAHAAKPPARHAAAEPGTPPAKPRLAGVRTVVECSGPFAKDSGMLALAVAFDSRNMIFTHETVQGTEVGVTVLFPKDPKRRLEVWWQNPNRTGTYLIDISDKSIWTAPKGLRLGLTLEQVEKLNHKAFKLKGFNDDGIAQVSDWDGGELASLPGGCKAGVSMQTKDKAAASELPAKDEYNSDDPAMRALKPSVNEILLGY
jgi:hypothetical protein